jgi:hypothetical protein
MLIGAVIRLHFGNYVWGPPSCGILRKFYNSFGCQRLQQPPIPKKIFTCLITPKGGIIWARNIMMKNLPTTTPSEVLEISPESLEVANCYLQNQDILEVAQILDIPVHMVSTTLARRDVKAYIDQVFFDVGFNNRFKMRSAMDALIKKKFQELEEADVGSNKDIAELLQLSHKMTMEQLDRQIELEKMKNSQIKSQVNVQINESGDGTRYGRLIQQLVNIEAKPL